ncbi:MAG TPA: hypothetical protein VFY38_16130 [Pseudonocardia sp.]|nr:hypothetical protein [Pseudonocardia sp.]
MIDTRIGPRGRWIRLVAAPVGALALVGLAACGTGTDTSTTSAGTSSAAAQPSTADEAGDTDDADADDGDTDLADYRSCLEDNGVTMPEPPAGGAGVPRQGGTPPSGAPAAGGRQGGPGGTPGQAPPGVDATTWAAAQKACADLAPTSPDGSAPTASSGN